MKKPVGLRTPCDQLQDMIKVEGDLIAVPARVYVFIKLHGIKGTCQVSDGTEDWRTLATRFRVPTWAWQLYDQCGNRLLLGCAPGPLAPIFEYAVYRAVREPEFCLALAAALDAGILVSFVNQQRRS